MTDVQVWMKLKEQHGRRVLGKLPNGSWIEIELDRRDGIEDIESEDRAGFPASAVESVMPRAVRENDSYPADSMFRKVEFDHGDRIEIEGWQRNGLKFDAEFTASGRLVKMKVDD